MAAAKKHSRKVSKKGRKSIFCFFGGCFGISNKVSADHHGQTQGKLVKHGETTTSSDQIICSSREIHVVEAEEEITNDRKVIDNKRHDMLSKNNKSSDDMDQIAASSTKQNDLRQKNWVNPIKLSHSMSLPLPRQTRETAAGGGHKGKTGKELTLAGEFDSMLGALIIMVTLIVMLIWGKVCAILCTAVWLYFIPRLRANINESNYVIKLNNIETNQVDFDSREYKKNIVLKGLLHRNQHVL